MIKLPDDFESLSDIEQQYFLDLNRLDLGDRLFTENPEAIMDWCTARQALKARQSKPDSVKDDLESGRVMGEVQLSVRRILGKEK